MPTALHTVALFLFLLTCVATTGCTKKSNPVTPEQHIQRLIQSFEIENTRNIHAAQILSGYGKQAIQPLLKALKHDKFSVRILAVKSLSYMKERAISALPQLIVALQDKHVEVRVNAAEAIGLIKARKGIPALLEALRDKNRKVRAMSEQSLRWLKVSDIPALVKAYHNPDPSVRLYVLNTFALLESRHAKALLTAKNALKDKDKGVRDAAAFILKGMGSKLDSKPAPRK